MQPGASRQRQRFLPLTVLVLALLVLPQLARQSWGAWTATKQAVVAARPVRALQVSQLPISQPGGPVPSSGGAEVSTFEGQAEARPLASQELVSDSLSVVSSVAQLEQQAPSPPPPTPPSPPPPTPPSPSPSPASKVLYVIRTHVINELVSTMLAQLSADFGSDSVFILMDDTKQPSNGTRIWRDPWTPGQQMLYVNEQECKDASSFHNEMYTEGQTPMGMMYKYLEPVDFQYVWFIDWDVLCNGRYSACFDMPPANDDLLVTALDNLAAIQWDHTDKLVGELSPLPRDKRWKSFFPLVRFSRKFLHRLYTQLQVSGGFCELFTPTLCAATEGCTMRNIPNEHLGVFRYAMSWEDQRCSPSKDPDNKFYHPCKGIKDGR